MYRICQGAKTGVGRLRTAPGYRLSLMGYSAKPLHGEAFIKRPEALVNRGELGPEDFIRSANGTFLNERARKAFWEAWLRRLDTEVSPRVQLQDGIAGCWKCRRGNSGGLLEAKRRRIMGSRRGSALACIVNRQ